MCVGVGLGWVWTEELCGADTKTNPPTSHTRFDVLTDANLGNQKRVLEMLKESKARFRSSVVGAGNTYASIRLSSRYSLPGT